MRHVNIPIFIPHLGCPNMCVFCNQRTISGVKEFDISAVRREIEASLETIEPDAECEIAFFGGSFTGIERALMIELLKIANDYIIDGRVKSLRCSTRPDYIDEEIIDILNRYNVTTVELGLQSTSDKVLALTKRGHSFDDEIRAAELLRKSGISLVGQMMIGLPGSKLSDELNTAEFIIKSGAVGARIYPTVVFHETELCQMAMRGEYIPITNEEAVLRAAEVYEKFFTAGVDVIRIGLQTSEGLTDKKSFYAGAGHSAIGELVLGEFYYKRIKKALAEKKPFPHTAVTIYVPTGEISKCVGQKKKNKQKLISEFSLRNLCFKEKSSLHTGDILINEEGEINVLKIT